MLNREQIDDLFRCLLAGIAAPVDERQQRFDQSRQLLSAFSRIDDSRIRQELVLLIGLVSKMPNYLQQNHGPWASATPAQIH